MKQIFILLFLLSGLVTSAQQAETLRTTFLDADSKIVMVASHRAVHHQHPENSLPAIEEAIRLGVDIIEIDVKVSKDGVPFLMHDETINRTTTGKGDAEEFTWAELQQFHLTSKEQPTTLKIPSLKEALKTAQGKILVDLDLKTNQVQYIVRVVKETQTQGIVFFFDSDYTMLSHIKQMDNDLMLMPRAHSSAEADSAKELFSPSVIHIDFGFYNSTAVNRIKENDARVWINALGDIDSDIRKGKTNKSLDKLLKYGANIIQTDEPEALLKALRSRGLHP